MSLANVLGNAKFIFTGKMSGGLRADIESLCRQHGGLVGSSLNYKTDYLVVGDRPGKKKLEFANSGPGVSVITENRFYAMLDGTVPVVRAPVSKPAPRRSSRLDAAISQLKPIAGTVSI